MAWICDKNGNHRCEIKQLSYNGTFMEVSSITVTVESPAPVSFAIGDYIDWDYDGLRYTLDIAAGVEKQARRNSVGNAFVYENLVFLSPLKAADNADFLDVILGNSNDFLTNTEFSFYGTAWDYAKRLEANLCRLYGSGTWKVRIWTGGICYDDSPATGIDTGAWENKLVDVSGIKCLGGFQQIYDLWGCAYVFSVVNGVNYVDFYDDFEQYAKAWQVGGVDKIFAYGKGNGLYKIRHTPDADHVLVTRLRPYGSGENIPANYYFNSEDYHVDGNESSELAISHLMLPASQWTKNNVKHPSNAYLEQNTDLYGVREGVVLWDGSDEELGEIKPSIYGLTIQDLLSLMSAGDSYRPVEAKWPDTSQRIDKIITGASPTDNGAVAEAGYDFTEVEASGSLEDHSFGTGGSYSRADIVFDDLVMGTTPSVSHPAEYRIVPTSQDKIAVSFEVQESIASTIKDVTAYLTPYVGDVKVEDATFPCFVSEDTISHTVDGITYKKRYNISLLDSTGNPIVFSTMRTGAVTFHFRAHIDFSVENSGFPFVRNEYAVNFDLIRGSKAIDGFFAVTIPQIGFDLSAAVSSGAKLCMRSGANQPREFAIVPSSVRYLADSDTWYIRCKRSVDQSIKTYFPNSDAVIAPGDEYYLSGIVMPSLYVEIAANKLLAAATAWLNRHSKPRMLSSVDVDNKIMVEESIVLKEGMALPISDTDLGITTENQESRVIDNIRIEEGTDSIRTFSITLRDKKEKSSLDAAIRGATSNFATNSSVSEALNAAANTGHGTLTGRDMPNQHPISAITGLEDALLSSGFFELGEQEALVRLKRAYDYLGPRKGLIFVGNAEADENADLEKVALPGGGYALHSRLPIYSDSFISAGGISPGGGAAPGNTSMRLITGGGRFTNGTDTLDVYSMSKVDELLASAGSIQTVAGVSPVSGDIPVASLSTALGLGAAASYAVATSVSQGDTTHLVTGAAVHTAINSAVSSVLRFEGGSSTVITDGGTQTPTIGGVQVTPYKGMVVLYGAKEFVWGGSAWEELGDEASWALKTTTISAGTGLTGGGTLASNRTISLSQATQDSLALANTALQSHQTIYALTIKNSAGTNVLSYTPNSAAGSLTLTKAMVGLGNVDNTAAADYFTVLENSSNQISLTIGGTNKKLTVAYATKALQDSAGNQINTHYLPKATFDDMFEKVALSGGGYAIKAKYGLYTDQFLSAGGLSTGGGTSGIDLAAMWASLQNNDIETTYDNYKIAAEHLVTTNTSETIGLIIGTGLSYNATTHILTATGTTYTAGTGIDITNSVISINSTYQGYFDTISDCLQSLQSQVDSVSTRDMFDDLYATTFFADQISGSNGYFGAIELNGSDLATINTGLGNRISTLEGYFDASGNAKKALQLTNARTLWGQSFDGTANVSGDMTDVGSITATGALTLTTTKRIYFGSTSYYIELDSNGYLHTNVGFYSDSFVSAGGLSTGGGTSGIDWSALAYPSNEQINITHLTDALAGYATTASLSNYLTTSAAASTYQTKYGFTITGTSGATYNLANFVTSSGVTSVATGTGLTGGTITSTGTISIDSTYQTYISNGNTAYGWGNHANAGYFLASNFTASNIATTLGSTYVANANYATSAGNSDTLDNYHASGLLTSLSSSSGSLSIGIGGATASSISISASTDSDGYNIASNMTTIGSALRSLQAQVDSVAARPYGPDEDLEMSISLLFNSVQAQIDSVSMKIQDFTANGFFDTLSVGAGIYAGSVLATGYITAGSASDMRLKDNIYPMNGEEAKRIVMALSPVTFTWNDKATSLCSEYKGNDWGFVAQQVQPIVPTAIGRFYDYLRLNQEKFIAPLVSVAQDHERRLTEIERKLNS